MPSIRDVAKQAGCSTSTVSRVINNRDAVDPVTKQKVLDAIDFLGYKPNLVAQGLRVKRGNLIGLVVPEDSPSFSAIMHYTMESARRKGFNVIFGSSNNDPDIEADFIDDLLRRHINGIIFSRVSDESRVLHKIKRKEVPIVIIDRALEKEGIPSVILDNYMAGKLAAEHLLNIGHERIACITGPLTIALCRERLKGFKETLESCGIPLPSGLVFEGDFVFESGIQAAEFFFKEAEAPTAIWAMNDAMIYGARKYLYENNIRVPEDISLIGMDDLPFSHMINPSLTTVTQPFDQLAEKAVELIEEQQTGMPEDTTIVVEPGITVRNSTAEPYKRRV